MSDPFWDEVDAALPRVRRGESSWASRRAQVRSLSRGGKPVRLSPAGVLAASLAAAALALIIQRSLSPSPSPLSEPAIIAEDMDFLESAPLLEHLDVLLDAPELDQT